MDENRGMERPRRRYISSLKIPAKLEASSWAEEVSYRRAVADSLAMAWQESNKPMSTDRKEDKEATALGRTGDIGASVFPEAPKNDALDTVSRRKRRKIANIPPKRHLQHVPECGSYLERVKEKQTQAMEIAVPCQAPLVEQRSGREEASNQKSCFQGRNDVVIPSVRVHPDERSATSSEICPGLRSGAVLGEGSSRESTASNSATPQPGQRPIRITRGKRRPPIMDLPSKEEEAMLQCALSNSLAITRREQSAFDLITEAPVYAPSDEEFADPVGFIESIRPTAEQYGLCKVVPPEGWDPPFCLDPSTLFSTRRQKIHRLQQGEGFCQSHEYSWEGFKAMALEAEEKWIRRFGSDTKGDEQARILEREFWRIVDLGTEEVEVDYGSDLMVGSGFPTPSKGTSDKYACSPWNLLNLPRLRGSLLEFLDGTMPGVTVPWMYIGMIFTAFCFHTEDNFLYSVNYHHLGAPKTWYGVPAAEAATFERAMRQEVPALFATRPNLLHELVTAVSPTHLLARKVPLFRLRQMPGEFVITYPRAYHAGFNHGFNCAEAVNFAPVNWLPFGAQGMVKYRRFHKMSALNFHELLCKAAREDLPPSMAPWLEEQLAVVLKQQMDQREAVAMDGTVRSRRCSITERSAGTCAVCQSDLYLAAVMCPCKPKKQACLQCAAQICSCGPACRVLLYRLSVADLERLWKRMRLATKGQQQDGKRESGRGDASKAILMQARLESYRLERSQRSQLWVQKAEKVLEVMCTNSTERETAVNLLQQAEEFLWGGSNMDGVRSLCERLQQQAEGVELVSAPMFPKPSRHPRTKRTHKIMKP